MRRLAFWGARDEGERCTTADGKVVLVTGMKKMQEQLIIPVFPKSGQITNWLGSVATGLQSASGYWDGMEIPWIYDCRLKTVEELSTDVLRAKARNKERWVRMDLKLATHMLNIVRTEHKTRKNDPLLEDILLKNRVAVEKTNKTLGEGILCI